MLASTRTSNDAGKQFEKIVGWFLLSDPVYRDRLEKVWSWDEWKVEHPGKYINDSGIDLVARDRSGALWAVQAKALTTRSAEGGTARSAIP